MWREKKTQKWKEKYVKENVRGKNEIIMQNTIDITIF